MSSKAEYKTLNFLEWGFYVGSLLWTVLTFCTFVGAFSFGLEPELFDLTSNFYWLTVILYAATRKITQHKYPDNHSSRKSEFILVFWMIVGLIFAGLTIFNDRSQLPLMRDLLWMYGILIGILLGGKAANQALAAIFKNE